MLTHVSGFASGGSRRTVSRGPAREKASGAGAPIVNIYGFSNALSISIVFHEVASINIRCFNIALQGSLRPCSYEELKRRSRSHAMITERVRVSIHSDPVRYYMWFIVRQGSPQV